ncbi:MAG TPA: bacteriocin family protein [Clostridia bacterium]|nr:bacteriocin family protein [Clostridia bacterium]
MGRNTEIIAKGCTKMEFISREDTPLTDDEWKVVDEKVLDAARASLGGRRFLSLAGPLGAGTVSIPIERPRFEKAAISLSGESREPAIDAVERRELPIPVISCDFRLEWRDLERVRRQELPFDASRAAVAALQVARAEDHLVFFGNEAMGIPGLLNCSGCSKAPLGDWSQPGQGYKAVSGAVERLLSNGYPGPFTLVVSPRGFAGLNRVLEGTPLLELDRVENLIGSKVLVSPALGSGLSSDQAISEGSRISDKAVLLWSRPEAVDLVIGQDITTVYLESTGMVHFFRVLESVVLRIKLPDAICVIE